MLILQCIGIKFQKYFYYNLFLKIIIIFNITIYIDSNNYFSPLTHMTKFSINQILSHQKFLNF